MQWGTFLRGGPGVVLLRDSAENHLCAGLCPGGCVQYLRFLLWSDHSAATDGKRAGDAEPSVAYVDHVSLHSSGIDPYGSLLRMAYI